MHGRVTSLLRKGVMIDLVVGSAGLGGGETAHAAT